MGKFSRLWELSQRMIQRNFHRFVGAEAVGSSGHHSNLVIQAFDRAAGNLSFGFEPVHQQILMSSERPRHLLHRLDAAAQSAPGPVFQKIAGVPQGLVAPKVFKKVFERPGPRRDRKSTRLNSSRGKISDAVYRVKKKKR